MKDLQSAALKCLLILCVGFLPVSGFAAVDELHHPSGVCLDCDIGMGEGMADCDTEFCGAAATSCGSHHGNSMIVTHLPDFTALLTGGVNAARGNDKIDPLPPSRIDRPPIT